MRFGVIMAGAVAVLLGTARSACAGGEPVGRWDGTCGPPDDRRAVSVTLTSKGGAPAGTIDLPSGGLLREPLTRVTAHGDSLEWVLSTDLGEVVFAGVRHAKAVSGRMRMGTIDHGFELAEAASPESAARGEDVSIPSGAVTLAATLFAPAGRGPFPAVVFLHGSGDAARLGPGDRSRVQAYLDEGIAVLVYDKRGIGGSTGDYRRVGMRELAQDGLAAFHWLGGRAEIRRDARGFDGRSQGCWLAEMAAAADTEVAFVVAQVGGGVAPWRQEIHRIGAELAAAGAGLAALDSARAWVELHYAVARGDSTRERYRMAADAQRGTPWLELKRPYASIEQARASWERLSSYEPAEDLARIRCPLLAVLAEQDRSTPTPATAKAFRESKRPPGAKPFEVRIIPGVGHEMLEWPPSGIPRQPKGYPALVAKWVGVAVGASR